MLAPVFTVNHGKKRGGGKASAGKLIYLPILPQWEATCTEAHMRDTREVTVALALVELMEDLPKT